MSAPGADGRVGTAAMRAAYVAAGAVAGAVAAVRSRVGSAESRRRWAERTGRWAGHAQALQPWIWIHAASVGEADIAVALARALASRAAGVRLVISSMTVTGKARVEGEEGIESRYFPVDFAPFVKRILEPRPPLLFVAVETEIWPETLRLLGLLGVPATVVNARLSDESLPRYRRLRPLFAPAIGTLARVCARDAEAAARWLSLGASRAAVEVTGNIKFDLATPQDHEAEAPLFERSAKAPLLLAASTHEGEEALAMDAFTAVGQAHPGARLVVAPRHPPRAEAACGLARQRGLRVVAWSEISGGDAAQAAASAGSKEPGAAATTAWPPAADVVVLDRLGLLRAAYAAADAAFVGGSAVAGPGGHNLLEAVMAGCPPAAGPHLGNVADQAAMLAEVGALRIVHDVSGLSRFWLEVLERPTDFDDRVIVARAAIPTLGGALARTVAALVGLLPGRS